jgi:LacI family transcriptional regulator
VSATLQDIALKLGLSRQAVSQAINNTGRLHPDTRRRVLTVARELHYRPNAAARATATGRFHCVALLTGTEKRRSRISAELLSGIHAGLAANHLNLMLVRMPDERLTDSTVMPRALEEATSDGFLIDYTHGIPERMKNLIERFSIPAIWINSKQDHDCVRPADLKAGREATEYLLSMGHRKIAFAQYSQGPDFPKPHYSVAERVRGYGQAMRAAGLSLRVIAADRGYDVSAPKRVAFSRRWLTRDDRPTAVLCYGASEAQPIFHAATCVGLSIPGDLSLATFGEDTIKWFGPHTTTWLTPDFEVGREAVAMLLERIRRPDDALPSRVIPFGFYANGATCAPLSARARNRSCSADVPPPG